jgi:hypothetical protein
VVFCPFCLHSGSANTRPAAPSRYVLVQSFQHHTDARLLRENLVRKRYLKGFHPDTHAGLAAIAPELGEMLRGKNLWGEAMRPELAAFKDEGYFLLEAGRPTRLPLAPPETFELIDRLQRVREIEASHFPCGDALVVSECLCRLLTTRSCT